MFAKARNVVIVDASIVVRWFVKQPGHEIAQTWFERFIDDAECMVGPDILRFEVFGSFAKLQPRRDSQWGAQSFVRFERLGMRILPTTAALFDRAMNLARTIPMGSYDAIYLAHAESMGVPWLTVDGRVHKRFGKDKRLAPIGRPISP